MHARRVGCLPLRTTNGIHATALTARVCGSMFMSYTWGKFSNAVLKQQLFACSPTTTGESYVDSALIRAAIDLSSRRSERQIGATNGRRQRE